MYIKNCGWLARGLGQQWSSTLSPRRLRLKQMEIVCVLGFV